MRRALRTQSHVYERKEHSGSKRRNCPNTWLPENKIMNLDQRKANEEQEY